MNNLSKKESFKFLIQEFQNENLPDTFARELEIPMNSKKIITIYGPRRSGKSFYLYTKIKELIEKDTAKNRIIYINFEDDRILPLDFKDFNSLLEAYFELFPANKNKKIFLFLDEIQNIKNWEIFVRRIYDKEKVQIFITGSSSKLLSKEIATSLRGRTLSYAIYPLNFREFLKFKKIKLNKNFEYSSQRFYINNLLEEYAEYGGFPEVILEKNSKIKNKILEEYFDSLVYRDLAERYSLDNLDMLKDLLKFLFTNIVSAFSINSYYKSIKQNIPVSRETIADYLSFIQETDYFFLLSKFSYSLKEQKVNAKKIISLDNGLRNRISFKFSQDAGKNIENLIGTALKKQEKEVYYWQNKHEVDFIEKTQQGLRAINVTFGNNIEKREIESLLEFKNKFKNTKELILLNKDQERIQDSIKLIPIWKWLLKS